MYEAKGVRQKTEIKIGKYLSENICSINAYLLVTQAVGEVSVQGWRNQQNFLHIIIEAFILIDVENFLGEYVPDSLSTLLLHTFD